MPVTIKMLLDQYTEILRKIYGSHLKTVILYGSYARGDYKADSDIDIMILLDLSDIDIKQYRHELSGETFDFNMDYRYPGLLRISYCLDLYSICTFPDDFITVSSVYLLMGNYRTCRNSVFCYKF